MTPQMILDKMDQMIRLGFVTARMPEKMRVQVILRDMPGGPFVTKFLPVLCPRACGDLHYDLPDIGDQVLCVFLAYGLEQGFVVGSMYGKQDPPVQNPDKWCRQFRDGTILEYDRAAHALSADIKGSATIKATGPLTLEAPIIYLRGTLVNTAKDGAPGNAVISGGMQVLSGGISVPEGDVVAAGVSLVSHTTEGVMPGDGTSSHPTGGSAESPGTAAKPTHQFSPAQLALIEAARLGALRDRVEENGDAIGQLIICLPEIAAAMAEKEALQEDKDAWLYLHDMFRKWLSNPANPDAKTDEKPLWISWQWAISYFRAQAAYNEFTSHDLQEGTIYSRAAMKSLTRILCEKGVLDEAKQEIVFDFTTADWKDWEDLYFTLCKVPAPLGQPFDRDGLYTALGAFTLRALAGGTVKNLGDGKWELTLEKVSLFVHDVFNFSFDLLADTIGLGFWSCSKKDGARMNPKFLANPDYTLVQNSDFRNFRNRYGMGGNFLVLSEPHPVASIRGTRYEFTCPK